MGENQYYSTSTFTVNSMSLSSIASCSLEIPKLPEIKRVIFHDPATIILWTDGSKTVVKVHNEPFDKEKGMAMAVMKKILGDDFHKTIREWCE